MSFNVMYHLLNSNFTRTGETGRTYTVPTTDSSYAGAYSCLVTISSVTSEESELIVVTAAGKKLIGSMTYTHYTFANKLYANKQQIRSSKGWLRPAKLSNWSSYLIYLYSKTHIYLNLR